MALSDILYAAPIENLTPAISAQEALLQDPQRFVAPLDFSLLKDVRRGEKKTFIVHIQDAHSNLSGQQNLAGALDELMERYDVSLVLVEGGTRDDSLTPLKKLAKPEVWKRVAKKFLMEGKISGEEYLNLISERPMKIMGIEDKELYWDSLRAYEKLAVEREDILLQSKKLQNALEKLKKKFYPQELVEYEKLGARLPAGQAGSSELGDGDFEKRFGKLIALAEGNEKITPILKSYANVQLLLDIQQKEKNIDFDVANLEQAALIEELSKTGGGADVRAALSKSSGLKNSRLSQLNFFESLMRSARKRSITMERYPNLPIYEKYLQSFRRIDFENLFDEFERLEDEVYREILRAPSSELPSPSSESLLIRSIDRYIGLLDIAYRIQMSTKEFELFKINEPDFSTASYLAFVNRKLADLGYFDDLIPMQNIFEESKSALTDFYASVSKRDEAFIHNTERILAEEKQQVAVLIAGGYHTSNLKKLFAEKDFSYAVLAPIVTSETNQAKYEKILLEPIRKETVAVESVSGESKAKDKSLSALEADLRNMKIKSDGIRKLAAMEWPQWLSDVIAAAVPGGSDGAAEAALGILRGPAGTTVTAAQGARLAGIQKLDPKDEGVWRQIVNIEQTNSKTTILGTELFRLGLSFLDRDKLSRVFFDDQDMVKGYLFAGVVDRRTRFLARSGLEGLPYIVGLGVHPDSQKTGIATQLIQVYARDLHERGIEKLYLDVELANEAALQLYNKLGFVAESPLEDGKEQRMVAKVSEILGARLAEDVIMNAPAEEARFSGAPQRLYESKDFKLARSLSFAKQRYKNDIKEYLRVHHVLDAEVISNTLIRANGGHLDLLQRWGVLTLGQVRSLGMMDPLLFQDDSLATRLKEIIEQYPAIRKDILLTRLIPMPKVRELINEKNVPEYAVYAALSTRFSLIPFIDEALAVVAQIEKKFGNQRNAWIIVLGQGHENALAWAQEAEKVLPQIQGIVGSLSNAREFVIAHGHENALSLAQKTEEVAKKIQSIVGNPSIVWPIIINQGPEKALPWVLKAQKVVTEIQDKVGSPSNAWQIVVGVGYKKASAWVSQMEPEAKRIQEEKGVAPTVAWRQLINYSLEDAPSDSGFSGARLADKDAVRPETDVYLSGEYFRTFPLMQNAEFQDDPGSWISEERIHQMKADALKNFEKLKIALVLPTYDSAEYITDTLRHMLSQIDSALQKHPHWRFHFILSLNGPGQKETLEELIRFQSASESHRATQTHVLHTHIQGKVPALNAGAAYAKELNADVLGLVDDDLRYDEGSLASVIEFLAKDKNALLTGPSRKFAPRADDKTNLFNRIENDKVLSIGLAFGQSQFMLTGTYPFIPDDVVNDDVYLARYFIKTEAQDADTSRIGIVPNTVVRIGATGNLYSFLKRHRRHHMGDLQADELFQEKSGTSKRIFPAKTVWQRYSSGIFRGLSWPQKAKLAVLAALLVFGKYYIHWETKAKIGWRKMIGRNPYEIPWNRADRTKIFTDSAKGTSATPSAARLAEEWRGPDEIIAYFAGLFPENARFIEFLNSKKGQSGRPGEGFHAFEHPLEVGYLALLAAQSMGFEHSELLLLYVAAALHDFNIRDSVYQSPKVERTLKQIAADESLKTVLAELGLDMDTVSVLIFRTNHPWDGSKAKEFERRMSLIPDESKRESVRKIAELLQFADKAAALLYLEPEDDLKRVRGLYQELGKQVTDKELDEAQIKFMDQLKKEPLFNVVLGLLPVWARENWDKNHEFYTLGARLSVSPDVIKSLEEGAEWLRSRAYPHMDVIDEYMSLVHSDAFSNDPSSPGSFGKTAGPSGIQIFVNEKRFLEETLPKNRYVSLAPFIVPELLVREAWGVRHFKARPDIFNKLNADIASFRDQFMARTPRSFKMREVQTLLARILAGEFYEVVWMLDYFRWAEKHIDIVQADKDVAAMPDNRFAQFIAIDLDYYKQMREPKKILQIELANLSAAYAVNLKNSKHTLFEMVWLLYWQGVVNIAKTEPNKVGFSAEVAMGPFRDPQRFLAPQLYTKLVDELYPMVDANLKAFGLPLPSSGARLSASLQRVQEAIAKLDSHEALFALDLALYRPARLVEPASANVRPILEKAFGTDTSGIQEIVSSLSSSRGLFGWRESEQDKARHAIDARRTALDVARTRKNLAHPGNPPALVALPDGRAAVALTGTQAPISDISNIPLPAGPLPRKTLLVYGGLGAVVPRFYLEQLKTYAEAYNVELQAVDLLPKDDAEKKIRDNDLPYTEYFGPEDSLEGVKPDGVLILTRPDSHFDILQWAAKRNIPVFVEKPIVLPDQIEVLQDLSARSKSGIFAIDFFFDNPAAMEAIKILDEGQLGRLKSIRGRMIETNGIEPGREWLLDPNHSGGGLGMDMMVHLVALGEMLLERLEMSFEELELKPDGVSLLRQEGAPVGAETYAHIRGNIGKVPVDLGVGKGTHLTAYYLILEGSSGTLEVNLGNEKTPVFMELRSPTGEVVMRRELGSDIGYSGTTRKIFDQVQGLGHVEQAELDFRLKVSTLAVNILEAARNLFGRDYGSYAAGQDPALISGARLAHTEQSDFEENVRVITTRLIERLVNDDDLVSPMFSSKEEWIKEITGRVYGFKNRSIPFGDLSFFIKAVTVLIFGVVSWLGGAYLLEYVSQDFGPEGPSVESLLLAVLAPVISIYSAYRSVWKLIRLYRDEGHYMHSKPSYALVKKTNNPVRTGSIIAHELTHMFEDMGLIKNSNLATAVQIVMGSNLLMEAEGERFLAQSHTVSAILQRVLLRRSSGLIKDSLDGEDLIRRVEKNELPADSLNKFNLRRMIALKPEQYRESATVGGMALALAEVRDGQLDTTYSWEFLKAIAQGATNSEAYGIVRRLRGDKISAGARLSEESAETDLVVRLYGHSRYVRRSLESMRYSYGFPDDFLVELHRPGKVMLIGAGLGVASAELALRFPDVEIWAINKESGLWNFEEAVKELVRPERPITVPWLQRMADRPWADIAESVMADARIVDAQKRIHPVVLDIEDAASTVRELKDIRFDLVFFEPYVQPYISDKTEVIERVFNERVLPGGLFGFLPTDIYISQEIFNELRKPSMLPPEQDPQVLEILKGSFLPVAALKTDRTNQLRMGGLVYERTSGESLHIPLQQKELISSEAVIGRVSTLKFTRYQPYAPVSEAEKKKGTASGARLAETPDISGQYGLTTGFLTEEKKSLRGALAKYFLNNGISLRDADRAANSILRMKEGGLGLLKRWEVLEGDQAEIFLTLLNNREGHNENISLLNGLTQDASLAKAIRKVIEEHADTHSKKDKAALLRRLIPKEEIQKIVRRGVPEYVVYLALYSRFSLIPAIDEALRVVSRIHERVGGYRNAWQILIHEGHENALDWLEELEPIVVRLQDTGRSLAASWGIAITYGRRAGRKLGRPVKYLTDDAALFELARREADHWPNNATALSRGEHPDRGLYEYVLAHPKIVLPKGRPGRPTKNGARLAYKEVNLGKNINIKGLFDDLDLDLEADDYEEFHDMEKKGLRILVLRVKRDSLDWESLADMVLVFARLGPGHYGFVGRSKVSLEEDRVTEIQTDAWVRKRGFMRTAIYHLLDSHVIGEWQSHIRLSELAVRMYESMKNNLYLEVVKRPGGPYVIRRSDAQRPASSGLYKMADYANLLMGRASRTRRMRNGAVPPRVFQVNSAQHINESSLAWRALTRSSSVRLRDRVVKEMMIHGNDEKNLMVLLNRKLLPEFRDEEAVRFLHDVKRLVFYPHPKEPDNDLLLYQDGKRDWYILTGDGLLYKQNDKQSGRIRVISTENGSQYKIPTRLVENPASSIHTFTIDNVSLDSGARLADENPYGGEREVSRGLDSLYFHYGFPEDYIQKNDERSVLLIGVGWGVAAVELALKYPNLEIWAVNKEGDLFDFERSLDELRTRGEKLEISELQNLTLEQIESARARIHLRVLDIEKDADRKKVLKDQKFDMVFFEPYAQPYLKDKAEIIEKVFNENVAVDGLYGFLASEIYLSTKTFEPLKKMFSLKFSLDLKAMQAITAAFNGLAQLKSGTSARFHLGSLVYKRISDQPLHIPFEQREVITTGRKGEEFEKIKATRYERVKKQAGARLAAPLEELNEMIGRVHSVLNAPVTGGLPASMLPSIPERIQESFMEQSTIVEEFLKNKAMKFSDAEKKVIRRAFLLAFAAHQLYPKDPKKAYRKIGKQKIPYIVHPVGVAKRLVENFGPLTQKSEARVGMVGVSAALLHDIFEDTLLEQIDPGGLMHLLGADAVMFRQVEDIYDIILDLSKKEGDGNVDLYRRLIQGLESDTAPDRRRYFLKLLIKLSDKLDSTIRDFEAIEKNPEILDEVTARQVLDFLETRRHFTKYFVNFIYRTGIPQMRAASLYWYSEFHRVEQAQRARIARKPFGRDLLKRYPKRLRSSTVTSLTDTADSWESSGFRGSAKFRTVNVASMPEESRKLFLKMYWPPFWNLIRAAYPPVMANDWLISPQHLEDRVLRGERRIHAVMLLHKKESGTYEVAGGYLYHPAYNNLEALAIDEDLRGTGANRVLLEDFRDRFGGRSGRVFLAALPLSPEDSPSEDGRGYFDVSVDNDELERVLNVGPTIREDRVSGARLAENDLEQELRQAINGLFGKPLISSTRDNDPYITYKVGDSSNPLYGLVIKAPRKDHDADKLKESALFAKKYMGGLVPSFTVLESVALGGIPYPFVIIQEKRVVLSGNDQSLSSALLKKELGLTIEDYNWLIHQERELLLTLVRRGIYYDPPLLARNYGFDDENYLTFIEFAHVRRLTNKEAFRRKPWFSKHPRKEKSWLIFYQSFENGAYLDRILLPPDHELNKRWGRDAAVYEVPDISLGVIQTPAILTGAQEPQKAQPAVPKTFDEMVDAENGRIENVAMSRKPPRAAFKIYNDHRIGHDKDAWRFFRWLKDKPFLSGMFKRMVQVRSDLADKKDILLAVVGSNGDWFDALDLTGASYLRYYPGREPFNDVVVYGDRDGFRFIVDTTARKYRIVGATPKHDPEQSYLLRTEFENGREGPGYEVPNYSPPSGARLANTKYIVWDLDGVLLNTVPINRDYAARTYRMIMMGLPESALDEAVQDEVYRDGVKFFNKNLGRRTRDMIVDMVALARASKSADEYGNMYETHRDAHIEKLIMEEPNRLLMPGTKKLLKRARGLGIRMGIASTASPERLKVLEAAGILSYFGKNEIKFVKSPDEKVMAVRELLARSRVSTDQAAFVDDAPSAVKAVQAALPGLTVIGMPATRDDAQQMNALAVPIVDGMSALRNLLGIRRVADTARVLIERENGDILLLLKDDPQSKKRGFWELAGGKAEKGEPLLAAAERELREETGLKGLQLVKVGRVRDIVWTDNGPRKVMVYRGKVIGDPEIKLSNDDKVHSAFKWVPPSELRGMFSILTPATIEALKKAYGADFFGARPEQGALAPSRGARLAENLQSVAAIAKEVKTEARLHEEWWMVAAMAIVLKNLEPRKENATVDMDHASKVLQNAVRYSVIKKNNARSLKLWRAFKGLMKLNGDPLPALYLAQRPDFEKISTAAQDIAIKLEQKHPAEATLLRDASEKIRRIETPDDPEIMDIFIALYKVMNTIPRNEKNYKLKNEAMRVWSGYGDLMFRGRVYGARLAEIAWQGKSPATEGKIYRPLNEQRHSDFFDGFHFPKFVAGHPSRSGGHFERLEIGPLGDGPVWAVDFSDENGGPSRVAVHWWTDEAGFQDLEIFSTAHWTDSRFPYDATKAVVAALPVRTAPRAFKVYILVQDEAFPYFNQDLGDRIAHEGSPAWEVIPASKGVEIAEEIEEAVAITPFSISNVLLPSGSQERSMPPALNRYIDGRGYEALEILHGGSSTDVLVVRNRRTGKKFVLKYAAWDGVDGNGVPSLLAQARYMREARRKLGTAAFPQILDVERLDDGSALYIMEYLADSPSVSSWLMNKKSSGQDVLDEIGRIISFVAKELYEREPIQEKPAMDLKRLHLQRIRDRLPLLSTRRGEVFHWLIKHRPVNFEGRSYRDLAKFFEELMARSTVEINGRAYPGLTALLQTLEDHWPEIEQALGPGHYAAYVHGDFSLRNTLRSPDSDYHFIDTRGIRVGESVPDRVPIEYEVGKMVHSLLSDFLERDAFEVSAKDSGTSFQIKAALKDGSPGAQGYFEAYRRIDDYLRSHMALNKLSGSETRAWERQVRLAEASHYASNLIHRVNEDPTGRHALMYYVFSIATLTDFLSELGLIRSPASTSELLFPTEAGARLADASSIKRPQLTREKPSHIFLDFDNFLATGIWPLYADIYGQMWWRAKNPGALATVPDGPDYQKGADFFKSTTGLQAVEQFSLFIANAGVPDDQVDEFKTLFGRLFREKVPQWVQDGRIHLLPGAQSALESLTGLKQQGYPLKVFVLSNAFQFNLESLISALNLNNNFDRVIGVDFDRGYHGSEHKWKTLVDNIPPGFDGFVAMGGDATSDILAAKKAAEVTNIPIFTFATPTGSHSAKDLTEVKTDFLMRDLNDFSGLLSQWVVKDLSPKGARLAMDVSSWIQRASESTSGEALTGMMDEISDLDLSLDDKLDLAAKVMIQSSYFLGNKEPFFVPYASQLFAKRAYEINRSRQEAVLPFTVVSYGVGDGRRLYETSLFMHAIGMRRVRFVGIEYQDQVIEQIKERLPDIEIYKQDLLAWRREQPAFASMKGMVHMVDASFILHEIYSFGGRSSSDASIDHERGEQAVQDLLEKTADLLVEGGELFVVDGLLPVGQERHRLVLSPEYSETYERLRHDYKPHLLQPPVDRSNNGGILVDLTRREIDIFLDKGTFFTSFRRRPADDSRLEREMKEQLAFWTDTDWRLHFRRTGLSPVFIGKYRHAVYHERDLSNIGDPTSVLGQREPYAIFAAKKGGHDISLLEDAQKEWKPIFARHSEDDIRPRIRAYSREAAEMVAGLFKTRGVVYLDGPSSSGKTVFSETLAKLLPKFGVQSASEVIPLDIFLRPPQEREAMEQRIAGEYSVSKPFLRIKEDFYRNEEMSVFLGNVLDFVMSEGPPETIKFAVEFAYDRESRSMKRREFEFRRGDVLIIDGQFAFDAVGLAKNRGGSEVHVRIMDNPARTRTFFEKRTLNLNSNRTDLENFISNRMKIYDAAVVPSWDAYGRLTASEVDWALDFTSNDQTRWSLRRPFPAAGARLAEKIEDTTRLILSDGEGRVFLLRKKMKSSQNGKWELPGGKIDEGETPRYAMMRELSQEVGLAGVDLKEAGKSRWIVRTAHGRRRVFVFTGLLSGENNEILPLEKDVHDEAGWFSLAELKKMRSEGKLTSATIVSLMLVRSKEMLGARLANNEVVSSQVSVVREERGREQRILFADFYGARLAANFVVTPSGQVGMFPYLEPGGRIGFIAQNDIDSLRRGARLMAYKGPVAEVKSLASAEIDEQMALDVYRARMFARALLALPGISSDSLEGVIGIDLSRFNTESLFALKRALGEFKTKYPNVQFYFMGSQLLPGASRQVWESSREKRVVITGPEGLVEEAGYELLERAVEDQILMARSILAYAVYLLGLRVSKDPQAILVPPTLIAEVSRMAGNPAGARLSGAHIIAFAKGLRTPEILSLAQIYMVRAVKFVEATLQGYLIALEAVGESA